MAINEKDPVDDGYDVEPVYLSYEIAGGRKFPFEIGPYWDDYDHHDIRLHPGYLLDGAYSPEFSAVTNIILVETTQERGIHVDDLLRLISETEQCPLFTALAGKIKEILGTTIGVDLTWS